MYQPTTLGYAILGILLQPMTGYGVRKVFKLTPMGEYSSSPGSIYPALKRLEKEFLIEQYIDFEKSVSGKKLFRLTTSGRKTIKNWCLRQADLSDVQKRMNELMLRFVFMEFFVDTDDVIKFLRSVKKNTDIYIEQLVSYYEKDKISIPLHASLALEQGIEMIRANSLWAQHAIEAITNNIQND
jgi:DNA-binding PadR family transcriptional regulator